MILQGKESQGDPRVKINTAMPQRLLIRPYALYNGFHSFHKHLTKKNYQK